MDRSTSPRTWLDVDAIAAKASRVRRAIGASCTHDTVMDAFTIYGVLFAELARAIPHKFPGHRLPEIETVIRHVMDTMAHHDPISRWHRWLCAELKRAVPAFGPHQLPDIEAFRRHALVRRATRRYP